jgi:hypothetical protein
VLGRPGARSSGVVLSAVWPIESRFIGSCGMGSCVATGHDVGRLSHDSLLRMQLYRIRGHVILVWKEVITYGGNSVRSVGLPTSVGAT